MSWSIPTKYALLIILAVVLVIGFLAWPTIPPYDSTYKLFNRFEGLAMDLRSASEKGGSLAVDWEQMARARFQQVEGFSYSLLYVVDEAAQEGMLIGEFSDRERKNPPGMACFIVIKKSGAKTRFSEELFLGEGYIAASKEGDIFSRSVLKYQSSGKLWPLLAGMQGLKLQVLSGPAPAP